MEILYLIGILILSYLVYRLYKFSLTSQWDQIQWATHRPHFRVYF